MASSMAEELVKRPSSCWASNESTSHRSSLSSPQAESRSADRSGTAQSIADWTISSMCCQRSRCIGRQRSNFAAQPHFRVTPIACDCYRRYAQYFRRFFHGHAAEVSQLEHSALAGIERRQAFQRCVDRKQLFGAIVRKDSDIVQRYRRNTLATLRPIPPPRVVHQDAAHNLRGNSEELRSRFTANVLPVHQAQISLVHQGCSLEQVIGTFAAHVMGCDPTQLVIHNRHQMV